MAAAPAAPTIDPEYYARLRQLESGGDPNAVNPTSGAAGLFQFMPATASYYGLTDPTNQDQAYAAVQRLTADNASVLSRGFGRNPTDAELYLAHQQGAGGAMKLLSNPNAKAVDLVGRAAVLSNGGTADMTASDFTSMWKSRFGMSPTGNGQAPYNPPPLNAGRFSGGYIQTAQDAGRQRLMADAVASAPQGSGNDLVDSLVGEAGKTRQDVKSGLEFYGVPWPLSELGGEAVGLGKLGVSAVGAGYNAAVNAALDFAQSHGMSESDRNRLQRDIGQLTEVSGAAVPEAGSLAAGGGAIRDDIISTLKKWAPEGTAEHFAQATDLHPLGGAPMEQSFPARRPPGGPRPPRVLPRAAADEGETLTAPPPMGHNQPPEAMAPEPPPPARAEMTPATAGTSPGAPTEEGVAGEARPIRADIEAALSQQEQKAAPETPTGRRAITNVQLRDLSQADATAIAQRGDHLIQNPDTGQYVGAPRGIDTPEKLQAMRDRFDAVAETGIPGRMWYPNSRSAVTEITGGDTQRARLAASEMGLWSPQATPETNLGAMLQGHNAYEAGQPLDIVRTGAQARNYQAAREAGGLPSLGKKTGPFAAHLDPTQVSPSTSVNDIWHARAFSYTNKDGSTFDRALTPQEHSFLDAETLLAADRANQKQLGGFSDWGSGNVQASAWVGAKAQALMAKHPEMTMEEALEESKVDFSDVLQKHTAAGTYEQIPGAGTGHLPSLVKAPYGTRAGYSDVAPWTNPQGEDILYRSTGLYQRPTVKAQGYFTPPTGSKTPEVNPAFTARPLIDYTPSKAGPTPSDVSRGTMDAVETTRAYFDAQNMGGWHKLLTSGQAGQMDSAFVPMNRSLSPEEMTQLGTAVGKHGLSPSDTGQGVSLLNFGKGPKPADMPKLLKGDLGAAIKSVLPDAEPTRTRQFGNALLVDKNYNALMAAKNQGKGKATRALFKAIDNPAIPDIAGKLDTPELRQQALTLLERDEAYAAKTGDPIRQDIQNARRIVGTEGPEGGLDGLRKALAEGRIALPAVAGLVGLGAAAMPGRAQAAERGSQMPRLNPDQQALADAARRHMIARALAAQGQNGDTMLAHISPEEAAALQRGGGAGTRNPRTGLPQFYRVDSGGPGNVDDSGDDNGDPRKHPDYNPTGGTVGAPDPNLGLPGGASGAFNATGAGGSAPGAQPVDPTADDFQTASTALGNRGFASRAAGWLEPYGLHTVTPVEGDPSTYGPGGSLRHELNPAAFAGNAAGMAFGNPLLGMLGGLALGKGYEALGGPQIALGKSGKDASQDTMLAHVKPGTAAALKLAGGSGLPDWFTGLFHFAGSDPGVLERIAAGMYSRDRAAGPVSATPLAHPLTPPDIPVIPIAGGMPGSDMSALNPHVNQAYGVPAGTYPGGAVPGGLTAAQLGAALALGGGPAGGGPQSSVYGLTSQEPQDQGGQDSMPTPAPGALGGRDRSRTNSDRNRLYRLARIGLLMGPYATS